MNHERLSCDDFASERAGKDNARENQEKENSGVSANDQLHGSRHTHASRLSQLEWACDRKKEPARSAVPATNHSTVSGPSKIVRLITSVRAMCGPCRVPLGAKNSAPVV